MKVAIPSRGDNGLDEMVGEHFGRVPYFTIVDMETGKVEVIANTSHHMGGLKNPPEILHEHGVDVMLCSGLGRRAIMMFQELGIAVYIGAHGKVKDAIQMWRNNMLQMASDENACELHAFRKRAH